MTITLAQAREIALVWEDPDGTQPVFATFAAGLPVPYERLVEQTTIARAEFGFDAGDDLNALRDFAETSDDPTLWTDRDDWIPA